MRSSIAPSTRELRFRAGATARDIEHRLRRAASAFADLAADADPSVTVPATPEWNVADLVTHVAIECRRYRREMEGHSDWSASGAQIAETNRLALAAEPARDITAALNRIQRDVLAYADLLAARDPDEPSHHLDGGLVLAPRHAAGVLLGELVVHRRDIAHAVGREATMERGDALAIHAVFYE